MQVVDARGLSCPEPALMATQALKEFPNEPIRILVSTATQRVNVGEAVRRAGRTYTDGREGDDYVIDVR